ncbi:hypothetical protein SAMN04487916_108159 [Arthrobacter sp. ov407]|nr:hypothetical protein SAMN04487916_108159 [Arthrobacter sp. ov407]
MNLDSERVALFTADGPPYRGDIVTDLLPGLYWLKVDRRSKLWVFESRQVKTGLRFSIALDGPDPFSLNFVEPLMLWAQRGIRPSGSNDLTSLIAKLVQQEHDRVFDLALAELCLLSEVDLYDVLDELWATQPGVLNAILIAFVKASQDSDVPGQSGVLRALESFARPSKEVYVDAFNSCVLHPNSFTVDEERRRANLTNLQLQLGFDLIPPRQLLIYADDISSDTEPQKEPSTYGPGSLTYPPHLSRGTTPRLHAAKDAAIAELERQNAEFIVESFRQVANVLLSVYQSSFSISKVTSARSGLQRRVDRGPGEWRPDFEGGTNMRTADMNYQTTACNSPRGMGYSVNGVQFDGYVNESRTLLEAKNWMPGGRMMNMLNKGYLSAADEVVGRAQRQLAAAAPSGAAIEWRMASREAADIVRTIFKNWGFKIRVVYIAPL